MAAMRRTRPALLAVALAIGGLGVTASPAAAAGPDHVDFAGHGWGHGRGMGQWGAYGYARDRGWSAAQILDRFYGGTVSGTVAPDQAFTIYLCDLESPSGSICIRNAVLQGAGLGEIRVTSGAPFVVEGQSVAAGQAVVLRRLTDRFELLQAPGGCSATGPWLPVGGGTSLDTNMDIDSQVAAPSSTSQMLRVCTPKGRYYRGVLDYGIIQDKPRLLNTVGLDGYLRGVVPAEMPSTWTPAAVQAQAVAARSYALADNRFSFADTCDTTQCQVYTGAGAEASGSDSAIAATAGRVRTRDGAIVSTEFSSSTGGWTAGGAFPAVEDLGDDTAGNPHHDWTVRIADETIEARYPSIGDLQRIDVTARNGLGEDGGRVRQASVIGDKATVTVTGDQLRSALGLKSDWFTPSVPAPPKALVWTLRSSASAGAPTTVVRYGGPTDRAIACDWDGNGTDTLGVYSGGTWYLRNDLAPGAPHVTVSYGAGSYTPVCGDWDGNGTETIGVYTPEGWWLLRNSNTPGSPEVAFQYGYQAATPVVGSWSGRDQTGIGVYDAGAWMLRDTPSPGQPQRAFSYGYAGASPVVGDWDGDRFDGVGVYDAGSWMLRETASPGQPVRWFGYGYAGPMPISGRWAPAADGIGIIEVG
jgi:SpoIID/LytB domain protein